MLNYNRCNMLQTSHFGLMVPCGTLVSCADICMRPNTEGNQGSKRHGVHGVELQPLQHVADVSFRLDGAAARVMCRDICMRPNTEGNQGSKRHGVGVITPFDPPPTPLGGGDPVGGRRRGTYYY